MADWIARRQSAALIDRLLQGKRRVLDRLRNSDLMVGTLAAAMLTAGLIAWIGREEREWFEREAIDAQQNIERVLRANVEILRGLQAWHSVNDEISREQFSQYVVQLGLQERFPGFQASTFTRRITRQERAAYEQQVNAQIAALPAYPPFAIRPPGERDDYFVVELVEPFIPNAKAFGLDLGADPTRREMIEQARDTGRMAISGRVRMFMEPEGMSAFLVALPIYGRDAPVETIADRRHAFRGVVTAVFRMPDLISGALSPSNFRELGIAIYKAEHDVSKPARPPAPELLLYSNAASDDTSPSPAPPDHAGAPGFDPARRSFFDFGFAGLRHQFDTDLGGARLHTVITPLPAFGNNAGAKNRLQALLIGAWFGVVAGLVSRQYRRRQQAEWRARRSEGLLVRAVESMSDAIWSADVRSSEFHFISPAIERILGLRLSQVAKNPRIWRELVIPADHVRMRSAIDRLYTWGHADVELRILRPDGAHRWIRAQLWQTRDAKGNPERRDGILSDITEAKRAQEEQDRLAAILSATPDFVCLAAPSGQLVYLNPAGRQMVGLAPETSLDGMHLSSLYSSKAHVELAQTALQTISKDRVWQGESALKTYAGIEIPVSQVVLAHFNPGGQFESFSVIARDISALKKAETLARAGEARLRRLARQHQLEIEEERRRISRELHDELGQTLTVLQMNMTMLAFNHGANDKALAAALAPMQRTIDRLMHTIRAVVSALRPPALDMGISPAIRWLAARHSVVTGAECTVSVDDPSIRLDDARATAVFRIVQESLTNVARHAGAGEVHIALERVGETISLVVSDNGRGFEPATLAEKKSFGLLGIRERALGLGGQTELESAPGRGTRLTVSIPTQQTEPTL